MKFTHVAASAAGAAAMVLLVVFGTAHAAPHAAAGKPKPTKTTTATPTPTPTSTTPPPPPPDCTGGQGLAPGMNVQAAVDAAPEGTLFCFGPGTYNIGSIAPKANDVFDGGGRAAVLDGQNTRQYAFRSTVAGVTIRGFDITRYATPLQAGAVHAFGATGWTIQDNRIHHNAATAVATDSGARVLGNLLDYNGQQGYAAHGQDLLYENNEIAFNNANLAVDATWEAGGGKAWATTNAVFRNNRSHDNGGNGLWDDTNNLGIVYDGNTVTNNWGAGIYHEIGYNATIVNNTVRANGMPSAPGGGQKLGWLWDAGIQLRSSQGLDPANPTLVANNVVDSNYNGIALLESPAAGCTGSGEGAYGPCELDNILVRDNTVTQTVGGTGVVQDGAGAGVFSRNIHFTGNRYLVASTAHPNDGHAYGWFAWANTWPGFSGWQGYGHDLTGTFGLIGA